MRFARVALGAVTIVMLVTPARFAVASENARTVEARLAYLQNRDRAAFGRPAMRASSLLTSLAREHAASMAKARRLWHDPALPSQVPAWDHVGDNVGRSTNVDSLHSGFMASAAHRDNMLFWDYEQYGIGAVIGDDGFIYAVVIFFTPASRAHHTATSAAAPAAKAATPQVQTIGMLVRVLALDGPVAA